MTIIIVVCVVIATAFLIGFQSHKRISIHYKRRWLEATRLLTGDTSHLPADHQWQLKLESGKGIVGKRDDVDCTFFYAERRKPHERVLLDAMSHHSRDRGGVEKTMPTPEALLLHRTRCMQVIRAMNTEVH